MNARGLPDVLMGHANDTPEGVALLQKRRGRWEPLTWAEAADRVGALAVALDDAGIGPGSVVAQVLVMSRDAWMLDLATQAVGARSAAIDPDAPAPEIGATLAHLAPSIIAVDGLELADQVLDLMDSGQLEAGAQLLVRLGADAFDDAISFDELVRRGRGQPDRFHTLLEARSADDVVAVTIDHTATGDPVLAEMKAATLMAAGEATASAFGLSAGDLAVSVTPLAHTVERGATYAGSLMAGARLAFPETPASALAAVAEVQPTFLHATPTMWRAVATHVRSRLSRNSGIKRGVRALWERTSLTPQLEGRAPGVAGRFFTKLLGSPALRKLGMDDLRAAVTTGAVVSAGHLSYLAALGLEVRRGYGSARSLGLVALSDTPEGDLVLPASLMAGVEMQIDDGGHVEVAGLAVAAEGWTPTGDRARLVDEERVRVVGRGARLPDGSYAAELESQLCTSMYIEHVAVFARGASNTALIQVDAAAAGDWAQGQGLEFTTFESLCGLTPVQELIAAELDRQGGGLLHGHQLLSEPLSRTAGELTINREVDRDVVASRRAELLG